MSVQSPTRQYLRQTERREQILAAALDAFGRGGYHGTHVQHVVEAAGVARGTFYRHFKSKHEVFAALVDRMLAVFLDVPPNDGGAICTEEEAREVLGASYRRILGKLRTHRQLCRLFFDEAVGVEKGFRDQLESHYRAWQARAQLTLQRLVAGGVAREGQDLEIVAEAIVGIVERVGRRYVLPDAEPDIDHLVKTLVDFELSAVRA